jgi:prefoldin subunit 5
MMATDQERLAILETKLETLQDTQSEIKSSLNSLSQCVNRIENVLSEAKGSWRTLITIGGVMSAAGAVIGWFIERFLNH